MNGGRNSPKHVRKLETLPVSLGMSANRRIVGGTGQTDSQVLYPNIDSANDRGNNMSEDKRRYGSTQINSNDLSYIMSNQSEVPPRMGSNPARRSKLRNGGTQISQNLGSMNQRRFTEFESPYKKRSNPYPSTTKARNAVIAFDTVGSRESNAARVVSNPRNRQPMEQMLNRRSSQDTFGAQQF